MKRQLTAEYLSNRRNCNCSLTDDGRHIRLKSLGNRLYNPDMMFYYPVGSYADGRGGCLLFDYYHEIDELPYEIGFDFRSAHCCFMLGKYKHDEEGEHFYLVPPEEATHMLIRARWYLRPGVYGRVRNELEDVRDLLYFGRTKSYNTISMGPSENSFNFYVFPIGWRYYCSDVDEAKLQRRYKRNASLIRKKFTAERDKLIALADEKERKRNASLRFKDRYYPELEQISDALDAVREELDFKCGSITLCDDCFYVDHEPCYYTKSNLLKARAYLCEQEERLSKERDEQKAREEAEKVDRKQALECFEEVRQMLNDHSYKFYRRDSEVTVYFEDPSCYEGRGSIDFPVTLDGVNKLRQWIIAEDFKKRFAERKELLKKIKRDRCSRYERYFRSKGVAVWSCLRDADARECENYAFSMFCNDLNQNYYYCIDGVIALVKAARGECTGEEAEGLASGSHEIRMQAIRRMLLRYGMSPFTNIVLRDFESEMVARGLI